MPKCFNCGSPDFLDNGECVCCHVIADFNQEKAATLPPPVLNRQTMILQQAIVKHSADTEVTVPANTSLGLCFMNLRMFDKAIEAFEKAMPLSFDNPEPHFYAAVCLLKGRKPFLCGRKTIDKILEYANAATMIDDRGIYHYFIAYVKQDYFARKCFKISPDWTQELSTARKIGYSPADAAQLFKIIGVERPSEL
ncbi:MAG: hypothetical protein HDT28_08995 [Clostridiales bacterium]|nr:hypothetical protein [Clostridiales bacterium]